MRLGIDLDGVVADFNEGWTRLHREEFGSEVTPEMVTTWDGLHHVAGFTDMETFWRWARPNVRRPSIFRHLTPYPGALDTLRRLDALGHRIVIVTTKPNWARVDTLRWLADHEVPTGEIHITFRKSDVPCDVYLDDSPHVLAELVRHRSDAHICRFVRPWNDELDGTVAVASWDDFDDFVTDRSHR